MYYALCNPSVRAIQYLLYMKIPEIVHLPVFILQVMSKYAYMIPFMKVNLGDGFRELIHNLNKEKLVSMNKLEVCWMVR
jgi:hypothetical protein